ncbi:MAG: hypothetical protein U1E87_00250 [Alphaproteobacteria bacterium]
MEREGVVGGIGQMVAFVEDKVRQRCTRQIRRQRRVPGDARQQQRMIGDDNVAFSVLTRPRSMKQRRNARTRRKCIRRAGR